MRTRWRYEESPSWQGGTYSSGTWTYYERSKMIHSLEFMQDSLHDVRRLGKTLRDIGGNMTHMKMWYTSDIGWTPEIAYSTTQARGQKDVFIPLTGNSTLDGSLDANHVLTVLLDLTVARNQGLLTEDFVQQRLDKFSLDYLGLSDLDVLGANFVDAVRPTNPSVDLATAVAELLAERKLFSLPWNDPTPDGQWLNYNLAIAPIISTVQGVREAHQKQDALLKQYERDAGRLVRRRFEPPTDHATTTGDGGHHTAVFTPNTRDTVWYAVDGTWKVTRNVKLKRWFSGAFTYPLPPEGWRRDLAELERLYGVQPGIDTLWELIPFSFVTDYFANTGNVLSNINAFTADGLVMPYGYVMETQKTSWHFVGTRVTRPIRFGSLVSKPFNFEVHLEVKRRQAANPFGFGFDQDGITARQLSILGALGISFLRPG